MLYQKEREELCLVAKTMWDRNMTNAAGGNIAVRVNDQHLIMTPTQMSEQKFCDLTPWEILVVDYDLNVIEGDGKPTREINMHMGVLKNFPGVNCVFHAHAPNSLVFAGAEKDMPTYYEATKKLGDSIKCLPYGKACTQELADRVLDYYKEQGNVPNERSVAVLLAQHGMLVSDKSLKAAYNMIERVEANAYVAIHANQI